MQILETELSTSCGAIAVDDSIDQSTGEDGQDDVNVGMTLGGGHPFVPAAVKASRDKSKSKQKSKRKSKSKSKSKRDSHQKKGQMSRRRSPSPSSRRRSSSRSSTHIRSLLSSPESVEKPRKRAHDTENEDIDSLNCLTNIIRHDAINESKSSSFTSSSSLGGPIW